MSGGPAHLDTFDYKPHTGKKKHPGSVTEFRQRGDSGLWISELLPETARHADQLCVINGMHADTGIHAQSFLQLHTGERLRQRPSMGSWITYGLGTENENLPGFVVLASGGKTPSAGKSLWGAGFLPTVYQGVQCRTSGDPVLFLSNPKGMSASLRRKSLDAMRDLNQLHFQHHDDRIH